MQMRKARFVEHSLPDGTVIELRVVTLPSVGRKVRRQGKPYNKRHAVEFSSHIPTVRRRRERKAMLHQVARVQGPPTRGTAFAESTSVRLVDAAQLEHWSGRKVSRFRDGEGFVVPQRRNKPDTRPAKYPYAMDKDKTRMS